MGDNVYDLSMGSTMQLYQGDVGLQPVLQIAGACLGARNKASRRGPFGAPVARGSRARRTPDGSRASDAYSARAAFSDPLTAPPDTAPPADLRALENKTEGAEKRYRVMLSDGVHYVTAMLTSSLNQYVADDKLRKFSVIKLKDYFANEVNNRKCVVSPARVASPTATSRESWHPISFFPSRAENFRHPVLGAKKKRASRTEPNAAPEADVKRKNPTLFSRRRKN